MSTLALVKRCATKLGAVVLDQKIGGHHSCTVEAPPGFTWAEGLHEFVDSTNRPWKPDYADLLDRMSYGLKPCDDPECEWCRPKDDEETP